MSKKYRRFFWGFLKSQENWLNKMADQSYRLIRSGKLTYEFEECRPGKYRYAVEFIGERSGQDAAAYAAFLEDCGYRVMFKNINLDYSVAKVVFRPWAKKGGKFATTAGTYNRELLIVEKENDGRPFDLHTTEEDRIAYRKIVRRPWICLIACLLILGVITGGAVAIATASGYATERTATRIGYISTETGTRWSATYHKLNGKMTDTLRVPSGTLAIDIQTEAGSLTLEVTDASGNILLSETVTGDAQFEVSMTGKAKIRLVGDNHQGAFRFNG